MHYGTEQRALQLLRERPEPVASLSWLHAELLADDRTHPIDRSHLERQLRERPGSFLVLESPPPLSTGEWPAELRRRYEQAFGMAGLDGGPLVVLLTPTEPPADDLDPLPAPGGLDGHLRSSLVALCRSLAGEHCLHDALAHAVRAMQEIAQATRALPSPANPES
jgi:hypothetical protein